MIYVFITPHHEKAKEFGNGKLVATHKLYIIINEIRFFLRRIGNDVTVYEYGLLPDKCVVTDKIQSVCVTSISKRKRQCQLMAYSVISSVIQIQRKQV